MREIPRLIEVVYARHSVMDVETCFYCLAGMQDFP